MSEVYGWSHISRVYHVVRDQAAHGWVDTVCCGERWIDATSDEEPAWEPCRNRVTIHPDHFRGALPREDCDLCGKNLAVWPSGLRAGHNCIPIRARA